MSKTVDKIRQMSNEAASKKIAEEQQRTVERVNKDIVIIERILAMVKDRLIYKEVKPDYSRATYVVVTEEMVLHDYSNLPKYGSGTDIKRVERSSYSYEHTSIRVNGHQYLHAADLIGAYKFSAAKAMEKAEKEYELAKDRMSAIKDLEALEPTVKALMLNYQEHLGKAQTDDPA